MELNPDDFVLSKDGVLYFKENKPVEKIDVKIILTKENTSDDTTSKIPQNIKDVEGLEYLED